MYCSECGKLIDAGAKFCGECGAVVDGGTNAPAPAKASPPCAGKPPLSVPGEILPSPSPSPAAPAQQAPGRSGSALAGRSMSIVGGLMTLLALLLPWFQVSCGGVKIEIEGYRILTGTTSGKFQQFTGQFGQLGGNFGQATPLVAEQVRSSEGLNWMIIGWLVFVLLGAQMASGQKGHGALGVGLAVVAGVLLILYFLLTSAQAQNQVGQSGGLIHFEWAAGFWMACGGTMLVGVGATLRLADTS